MRRLNGYAVFQGDDRVLIADVVLAESVWAPLGPQERLGPYC